MITLYLNFAQQSSLQVNCANLTANFITKGYLRAKFRL